MIHAAYDKDNNLLRLTFEGKASSEKLQALYERLEKMAPEMKKGFRMLTDLSRLEEASLESRAEIARIMQLCNRLGVSEIVRVIPDPDRDIGLNIMSLFHYGRDVSFVAVPSLEEAEKHLKA